MKYEQPYGITDTDASYINGNPLTGQKGSIPPAAAIENPQREIVAVIDSSDFTPTDNDLMQLLRSVRRQRLNFAIDTGAQNSLVVTLDPPLEDYHQGFPLRVLAAYDNTGATQINVNGLGLRNIKRSDGSALQSGDIKAGMIANLVDTGTVYQLQNPLVGTASSSNIYQTDIPYIADTSVTPNTITAVYSPAITSISEGTFISVKVANKNTGGVTINVNALTGLPIYRDDGTALQAGDILQAETILLEHHGTYYQIIGLCRSQVLLPPAPKLRGFHANATGGVPQAIPASVATAVLFVNTNDNAMQTSTFDGYSLTVGTGEAGVWDMYACTHLGQIGVDCDFSSMSIFVNGIEMATDSVGTIVAGSGQSPSVADRIRLQVGDVVQFKCYQQANGGALNYTIPNNRTSCSAYLISV